MPTVYKSKIGYAIIIPLFILLGGIAVLMVTNNIWFGVLFVLLLMILIGYMLSTIYYTINGKTLEINIVFSVKKLIDITTIKSISETNNSMASSAASLDRLEIKFKNDSIIISPKDKSAFINQLLEINPSIEIKLKTNSTVQLNNK